MYIIITIIFVFIFIYFYDTKPESIITFKTKIKKPNNITDFCIDKILSRRECIYFTKKIKKHFLFWKNRNLVLSTLGIASYLDGNNFEYYKKQYLKSNKFLKENYGDLYKIILKYFQSKVSNGINVKYKFALPGFHIFKCNQIFSLPVASKHIDLQFQKLKFNNIKNIDFENTLSFTLCLELPKSGGGLYIYENGKQKVNYKRGYIVCHHGKTPHMIAPSTYTTDNEYRISLQGHGIYDKVKKTWWLYW